MKSFVMLFVFGLAAMNADAAPQQITAKYTVSKDGRLLGTASETFKQSGNQYRIESETIAIGIYALIAKGPIKMISTGEVTKNGLRPSRFEYHRSNNSKKSAIADFDWNNQTLNLDANGETHNVKLEPNSQDRLSILYQFMYAPPKNSSISGYITSGKKLSPYVYQIVGKETLTTAIGSLKTIHLSKQHQADEEGAEVWLAPSKSHFPVRVVITEENGSKLEQNLQSLSFNK